jgi:hypothetical protein
MQPLPDDHELSHDDLPPGAETIPASPQTTAGDSQNSGATGPVIFIGGLNDQNSAIVYREYERFKFARPDVPSRYFSHDENRAIGN